MRALFQRRSVLLLGNGVVALALILGAGSAGCDGKKKRPSGFPASVLHDFKAKGIEASKFQKTDPAPYGAKTCSEGQVEGLAVLLCQYESADSAKGSESKLLTYVQGAVTGVVRTRGKVALVVADPDKMDLRGKNIAKMVKAFSRK
jgi:hypothetical protein